MLRLDPHVAVFRTAPDRIAIGAQQRIADLDADPTTLRGIAALTRGVLPRELAHLVGEEACEALVQALSPAFGPTVPAVAIRVRGRIPLALELHRAARASGHPGGDDGVVIPVAPWRLPVAERERLAAAAGAQLPVVVGDAWVQVGPFVAAGHGCARRGRPEPEPLVPAHLPPGMSPIAAAQAIVSVLDALRRIGEGALPCGWAVRIRQRDGGVSAVRRRACAAPARRGTAMAA